jgi:hypothetical protein
VRRRAAWTRGGGTLAILCALALAATAWAADEPAPVDTLAAPPLEEPAEREAPEAPVLGADGLEALVPEVAFHPVRVEPGVRPFRHRLAFSPGFGLLGTRRLFVARVTYHPSTWLGYEWSIGHNPGQSVHAALHTLSAIVRRPFPGRFQPYASLGYGMMLVFPGQSINAAPVTKNALGVGAGLEFYIRGDLAVRADVRRQTVLGRERDRDGIVAYDYFQQTIGLAFYRSIRP